MHGSVHRRTRMMWFAALLLLMAGLVSGSASTWAQAAGAGARGQKAVATAAPSTAATPSAKSSAPAAGTADKTGTTDKKNHYDVYARILSMAVAAGIVLAIALWASDGHLAGYVIGADNRYSNSKCQLALWFGTLMVAYLSTLILRTWALGLGSLGDIGIPPIVAGLAGISAGSFAGAKAVTTQKDADAKAFNAANAGTPMPPKPEKLPNPSRPAIRKDLFCDDSGNLDIGDFQMIFVTLLVVTIYWLKLYYFLGTDPLVNPLKAPGEWVMLPDVDTSLLTGFGIGQGAYLLKKMVSPAGH